jgi:uncharacterized membrane protein
MNRSWLIVAVVALVIAIVLDRVVLGGWGYYAFFGFGSAMVLVGVSKFLGSAVVQQPEDYYKREAE